MADDRPPIMAEDILRTFKLDFVLFMSMLVVVLLARSLFRSDYLPPLARTLGLIKEVSVESFADLLWKLLYHMFMVATQINLMKNTPWRTACVRGCAETSTVIQASTQDFTVELKLVISAHLVYHSWELLHSMIVKRRLLSTAYHGCFAYLCYFSAFTDAAAAWHSVALCALYLHDISAIFTCLYKAVLALEYARCARAAALMSFIVSGYAQIYLFSCLCRKTFLGQADILDQPLAELASSVSGGMWSLGALWTIDMVWAFVAFYTLMAWGNCSAPLLDATPEGTALPQAHISTGLGPDLVMYSFGGESSKASAAPSRDAGAREKSE